MINNNQLLHKEIQIFSLKEKPDLLEQGTLFLQNKWANEDSKIFYQEALVFSLQSKEFLPQFYFGVHNNTIIASAGIILNDFIATLHLYPYLVALYVKEEYQGNKIATLLIQKAKDECKKENFKNLYLCSDLQGFYEKFDFKKITQAHDIWGYKNTIFQCTLS